MSYLLNVLNNFFNGLLNPFSKPHAFHHDIKNSIYIKSEHKIYQKRIQNSVKYPTWRFFGKNS